MTVNPYGMPDPPPVGDPTAALAALHYHVAAAGVLNMLHEAWERGSVEAKVAFADSVLRWAGMNIGQIGAQHLVQQVLGDIVRSGRFKVSADDEMMLVQLLYQSMVRVLGDKRNDSESTRLIREALVAAAKQRLGEIAAEMSVTALAAEPGTPET